MTQMEHTFLFISPSALATANCVTIPAIALLAPYDKYGNKALLSNYVK